MPDDTEPTKTLRDEFAMAALTGLMANMSAVAQAAREANRERVPFLAEAAYEFADAMMKERGQ